jgi:uncharacterized protein with HEPN domain
MAFANGQRARPYLPFSDADRLFRDIIDAIGMIDRFTSGMDLEAFRDDPKTVAAVERKLQVISEAAIRLGGEAEGGIPGVSWRNIRGMGNWLRHQYDRIELETIWKTATDDLPLLKAAIQGAPGATFGRPEGADAGLSRNVRRATRKWKSDNAPVLRMHQF